MARSEKGKEQQTLPRPPAKQADHPARRDDTAEEIREGSQTAQDREHTNRGGDDQTAPAKEFPT
jgi:hypothetical protein